MSAIIEQAQATLAPYVSAAHERLLAVPRPAFLNKIELPEAVQQLSLGTRIALILVGLPLALVVLNVLQQLIIPRRASDPPLVFHYFPFIGSAIWYGMDPYGFMFACREKYGNVFTFILLGRKVTVALGPKGNDLILNGKLSQVSAEEAYTHLTTPVFGKEVVYDVPNHVFMEQKKFVKFGLSSENMRRYVAMIEDEIDGFLKTDPAFEAYRKGDPKGGSFECFKVMSEITILTASRTLQGKEVRASLDKSFAHMYHDLDGGFTPLNFILPNLPLPSYRRRDIAQQRMSDFYGEIIRKRRETGEAAEYDMISSLMDQKYKNGRALNDREIAHIMIALLMAGQHTSSATSSWVLFHLGDKPDIVEALYQEQVKKFGTPSGELGPMSQEELRECPLLEAVIREVLRLHPPIHSIMRKVVSDIPVPPSLSAPSENKTYVIPKGNYVLASPGVSQVDPKVWGNPEEFDPYRWFEKGGAAAAVDAEEAGETVDFGWGAITKGTGSPYQPFGAGRHRCIGEQFAYLQLGTLIATLVRRMTFTLPAGVPKQDYTSMIVLPAPGSRLYYKRRD